MPEPSRWRVALAASLCVAVLLTCSPLRAEPEPEGYAWPVVGPVIRRFEAPPSPFEAGHRGIDIAVPLGTPVRASASGVVAFAGSVAGSRFVSVDHADGIRTTYSWLSAVGVRTGQTVARGAVIGSTGHGHPEVERPHLHFGARRGTTYVDPMVLLGAAAPGVHLAPLDAAGRPTDGGVFVGPWSTAGPGTDWSWWWTTADPDPRGLRGPGARGRGPVG